MFPWRTCHKSQIVSTTTVVPNPSHQDRRSTSKPSSRCVVRVLVLLILGAWTQASFAACLGVSPLSIITQPQSQFVFGPTVVGLSAEVLGTPVSYQWYRNDLAIVAGTNS